MILEAAVRGAVELHCAIRTGDSIVCSTSFMYINQRGLNKETPVRITQYSSKAPQTADTKMIIQLIQHLSEIVSTQIENYIETSQGSQK